jgi:hypothetical protein
MFWSYLQYLSIKRLGLAKPILAIALVILLGCLVAGFIYASIVFHAVSERSQHPHVHPHSTH